MFVRRGVRVRLRFLRGISKEMAKSKSASRRHRRAQRRRTHRRRQTGGAGYGYSAVAGVAAGGVPFENRASYEVCSDSRVAPVLSAGDYAQFGGGCCGIASPPYGSQSDSLGRSQRGGGSGTGGYGFVLNNDMGKVYADVRPGPCPGAQSGGGASNVNAVPMSSYSAGYGFGNPYSTPSAHFFEPQAYAAKTCMGGGSRRKERKSRKERKASKQRRKERKH